MNYNFKMLNSKVLTFDPIKDIEKIRFNHYIMRKENKNRLSGEFKLGQFKMTIKTVMEDLNLSKNKAERIIKEFENLNIIRCVEKGNLSKGYSVYEYVTVNSFNENMKDNKKDNMKKDMTDYTFFDNMENLNYSNEFDEFSKDDNKDTFMTENKKNYMKHDKNSKINNINKLYERIINYLNKNTKKNFKPTSSKTIRLINARLNEGFYEEDFYKVIDVKVSQWINTDMQKFLRPETLFSNKFEGYLNEVVKENNKIDKIGEKGYWDIEFDF